VLRLLVRVRRLQAVVERALALVLVARELELVVLVVRRVALAGEVVELAAARLALRGAPLDGARPAKRSKRAPRSGGAWQRAAAPAGWSSARVPGAKAVAPSRQRSPCHASPEARLL
jgi:hypothetical protein